MSTIQTHDLTREEYEDARDGTVEYVSPDSIAADGQDPERQPAPAGYRTVLTLSEQQLERDGQTFELRPGMQVTAEIRIGRRTVMEYLLSPIQKTLSESVEER